MSKKNKRITYVLIILRVFILGSICAVVVWNYSKNFIVYAKGEEIDRKEAIIGQHLGIYFKDNGRYPANLPLKIKYKEKKIIHEDTTFFYETFENGSKYKLRWVDANGDVNEDKYSKGKVEYRKAGNTIYYE